VPTTERQRYVMPTASYRLTSFLTHYIVSYYEWNTKAFDNIGDGCFPPGKLFGPDFTYIPGYNPNPPGFLRSVGEVCDGAFIYSAYLETLLNCGRERLSRRSRMTTVVGIKPDVKLCTH
jgi:hypothetical protein